jgi:hypothetical protein
MRNRDMLFAAAEVRGLSGAPKPGWDRLPPCHPRRTCTAKGDFHFVDVPSRRSPAPAPRTARHHPDAAGQGRRCSRFTSSQKYEIAKTRITPSRLCTLALGAQGSFHDKPG